LPHATPPGNGRNPDVAVSSGVLHMVFARGRDVFYARSTDNGETFSSPVRVSTTVAFIDRERGPRLAIGENNSIHVVWMNSPPHQILYARSLDGGRLFSEPRALITDERGADGPSVAADEKGNVYAVWLGMGDHYSTAATATIQLASSNDNGTTFSAPQSIRSNYPGGACACCGLKAFSRADGEFFIAFRGANQNIRDIYLLRATGGGGRFEATPVSNDRWRLEACPTMGPFVQDSDRAKQILVSWMSNGDVYYALSRDAGRTFSPRVAPPQRPQSVRANPFAVANDRGEILFGWIEERAIHWERTSPEGRIIEFGESPLTMSTKPSAFVNTQREFVLVY